MLVKRNTLTGQIWPMGLCFYHLWPRALLSQSFLAALSSSPGSCSRNWGEARWAGFGSNPISTRSPHKDYLERRVQPDNTYFTITSLMMNKNVRSLPLSSREKHFNLQGQWRKRNYKIKEKFLPQEGIILIGRGRFPNIAN